MKNQEISIKNKIAPKYFDEDNSKKKSNTSDINVLKSKLRDRENIILRKNISILIGCLALIVVAGICVTYL